MASTPRISERLDRAAAELADEIGFERLTVAAVARRLGVKDPSLYAHIANVHELRTRVTLLALAEMADRAAAALAGRAGRDALAALGGTYRDYAREHPGRYAASRAPLDAETAARSAAPRHSELARAVLRGYALPEPDATDAVRMLGATFHGFTSLEAASAFAHTPRPTEASWTWTLDALDRALRTRAQ
ncbi:TetR/AcrR family transcriptional regulator [Actinomadura flavalba]|uniref:TetR/AcrR family transcriptional regulator n=1 Tax=Actinomadura flavalba TaxID=1120938 RepID=UPI00037D520F|nr:TetR-like C-terminal domain-containing protein [Actinomadura flavalba]